ncbi:hypothetical protein G432_05605 [Sphingomonas sp. MM-1]|uniref:hypothetical protein n=1 Tax=Sphingomonas sp. MM-1 TaxID=745310 RepID=UPI0002C0B60B|nr:hypothetical protein [Sphingomonas sp. MM-1]AGH48848.1 hypothetical protein G432_05605 [Sphingomonas sp. MM-1]
MQRVRIGLTGLAGVFVLVLFAAAFFGVVSDEPTVSTDATGNVVIEETANAAAPVGPPKEPLAELGVAPGAAPEAGEGNVTPSDGAAHP